MDIDSLTITKNCGFEYVMMRTKNTSYLIQTISLQMQKVREKWGKITSMELIGFELCQRILEIDLSIRVCFVIAVEIN